MANAAVRRTGGSVELMSLKPGQVRMFHHLDKGDTIDVDGAVSEADVSDYDGLVIPGGVANPGRLRTDESAVRFVRAFFDQEKPVAVICHGPWMLVEAGVADGRRVTSWRSLQTDLRNAGASWVDKEVVVDHGLVTSRKPDDLPVFCATLIAEFVRAHQGPEHRRECACRNVGSTRTTRPALVRDRVIRVPMKHYPESWRRFDSATTRR